MERECKFMQKVAIWLLLTALGLLWTLKVVVRWKNIVISIFSERELIHIIALESILVSELGNMFLSFLLMGFRSMENVFMN